MPHRKILVEKEWHSADVAVALFCLLHRFIPPAPRQRWYLIDFSSVASLLALFTIQSDKARNHPNRVQDDTYRRLRLMNVEF
jgi:hypothetical protein